jgi:hypothetical protein
LLDLSVQRQFLLKPGSDRFRLKFTADFFNVLNHPNVGSWGISGSSLGNLLLSGAWSPNSTFGYSTSTATMFGMSGYVGGIYGPFAPGNPRSIQFGLRLLF